MGARRVFIGYHEIAGYCLSLKHAFTASGYHAHFCNMLPHVFYAPEGNTAIERLLQRAIELTGTGEGFSKKLLKICLKVVKLIMLSEMLIGYDAFILVGNYSPLGLRERRVLRLFGKRVISVFLGTDSRPYYLNGAMWEMYADDPGKMASETLRQKAWVQLIEGGSDMVVCHALSAHFLSRPFVRFLALGFPLDPAKFATLEGSAKKWRDQSIRIVHAPSNPKCKGSDIILKNISELCEEGMKLEPVYLTGRPNREVLEEISNCDFVVDEIYSDTPLAGLAVEAASAGKPSIVGTYAERSDFQEKILPPSYCVPPSQIKEAIRKFATDADYRNRMGRDAQAFMHTSWSASEVVRRFIELIEDRIDPMCMSDPLSIDYIYGWGIERNTLKKHLRNFVGLYGLEALLLSDKPIFEDKMKAFIGSEI